MVIGKCIATSGPRTRLRPNNETNILPDRVIPPGGDGYKAAMVNYAFLAHGVVTTDEVVASMECRTSKIGGQANSAASAKKRFFPVGRPQHVFRAHSKRQ